MFQISKYSKHHEIRYKILVNLRLVIYIVL